MRFALLAFAFILAGCSNGARIGSGDIADGITTAYVLTSPVYVEMNPTIPNDPVAGVGVLMAQKLFGKWLLVEMGVDPDTANRLGDAHGWLWACHNLAFFAGSGHPLGLTVGAICAALYWEDTDA